MSFENLIGNNKIKKELQDIIKSKNILNSYMFIGQEGIGKKIYATEFAKMILCMSDNKESCKKCESCIKFESGNHPDYFYIEPEGNSIKIAVVRQMQESIYQKPILSNRKIYIVNDADKMTVEAQNALLKTLEEPPEYVSIILIVSNENLLLNTIKSRCLRISFKNIDNQEIYKYIKNNGILEEPSKNIINMCNGSFAKVQRLKNNLNLYLDLEENFKNLITKKEKSLINNFKNFDVLYKNKEDIQSLLEYMIVIIYNLIKEEEYSLKYISDINIIEDTRKKILSNANYDMSIDELLLKLFEN